MQCVICEGQATSLHFGAPSFSDNSRSENDVPFQACAAFFRRTVALDITYDCLTGKDDCEVSSERRIFCKKCRYKKCIQNNMQRILVRSKKGRTDDKDESLPSPPEPDMCSSCASTSSSTFSNYQFKNHDDSRQLTAHILQMDSNLNKSRRMAFTDARLLDIFAGVCEMPFEKNKLRPFEFRTYNGYQKQEYLMMFSYANSLPDFHKLCSADQNFLFRLACGVDFVISSAYYTVRIGVEHNMLVSHDGTFVVMEPLPPKVDDSNSSVLFSKKDEFEKYKNLIQPKVRAWKEFIPKYENLELSFEENAILKAIATWQLAQFNFDDAGKEVSREQKSKLMKSLLRLCQDNYGEEEGSIRTGNIAIFVSLINDEVLELVSTLLILSVFEIIEADALIKEILTTGTLH